MSPTRKFLHRGTLQFHFALGFFRRATSRAENLRVIAAATKR